MSRGKIVTSFNVLPIATLRGNYGALPMRRRRPMKEDPAAPLLCLCASFNAFHPSLIWRAETNAMERASSVVADGHLLSDLSGDLPASLSIMGSYYATVFIVDPTRHIK